jgi:hypothetical protein
MKPVEVTLGRNKFQRFSKSGDEPLPFDITIGSAGQYVLVGFGKGAVEGMIDRLRLKQVPAWLTALQKRLPVERRASMSYVDVAALVDAFLPLGGPDAARVAQALGVDQLGVVEMVTGLDKEGMVSKGFMKKDATMAGAFSLDALKLYEMGLSLVTEFAPGGAGEIDRMEGQFAEMFGQSPRDVIGSFGNVWTYAMSPADGWLG